MPVKKDKIPRLIGTKGKIQFFHIPKSARQKFLKEHKREYALSSGLDSTGEKENYIMAVKEGKLLGHLKMAKPLPGDRDEFIRMFNSQVLFHLPKVYLDKENLEKRFSQSGYLNTADVHPEYMSKGIGGILIRLAFHELAKKGMTRAIARMTGKQRLNPLRTISRFGGSPFARERGVFYQVKPGKEIYDQLNKRGFVFSKGEEKQDLSKEELPIIVNNPLFEERSGVEGQWLMPLGKQLVTHFILPGLKDTLGEDARLKLELDEEGRDKTGTTYFSYYDEFEKRLPEILKKKSQNKNSHLSHALKQFSDIIGEKIETFEDLKKTLQPTQKRIQILISLFGIEGMQRFGYGRELKKLIGSEINRYKEEKEKGKNSYRSSSFELTDTNSPFTAYLREKGIPTFGSALFTFESMLEAFDPEYLHKDILGFHKKKVREFAHKQ
jgi:hypothetical protein